MLGDSVVGCVLQAPENGDESPGAGFCKLVRVVRAISRGRQGIIWQVNSLILSYQLGVPFYPERCPKKETYLVKAPLFAPLSNLAALQIVKRKILHI